MSFTAGSWKPRVLSGERESALPGYGVFGNVRNLFTVGIDYPSVPDALKVILGCFESLCHAFVSLGGSVHGFMP